MVDAASAPGETDQDGTGKKTFRRRILAPILFVALFLAGLAGGAVIYFGLDRLLAAIPGDGAEEQVATEDHSEEVEGDGETVSEGATEVFLMEDHIVNLVAPGSSSSRFVRVRVAIVHDSALLPIGTMQERKAHLRDAFQEFLGQLTERDLEGSYGLTMLKAELLSRTRAIVGGPGIQEVLITDLVIQ